MTQYIFLALGLVLLALGGDILVRGAVGMAAKLGISPLIIGLTVVAFGTSAPELFVSIGAALDNAAGIAVGNVVGSNIANILLVIGLPALIAASGTPPEGLWRNLLFMCVLSLILLMAALSGQISIPIAAILLAILAGFLFNQYLDFKNCESQDLEELEGAPADWRLIILLVIGGLAGLQIGADWVVGSAVSIANEWGISDTVIGVTIVAIGTSLPELAAAVMSAIKGRAELAIGNIVGSNIFNIALILGVTAMIAPVGIDPHILKFDIWVMLGSAALLVGLYGAKVNVKFGLGMVLSLAYGAYLFATLQLA